LNVCDFYIIVLEARLGLCTELRLANYPFQSLWE